MEWIMKFLRPKEYYRIKYLKDLISYGRKHAYGINSAYKCPYCNEINIVGFKPHKCKSDSWPGEFMTNEERLKGIEELYNHLSPIMREIPHNSNVLWLISRVKELTEALNNHACQHGTTCSSDELDKVLTGIITFLKWTFTKLKNQK